MKQELFLRRFFPLFYCTYLRSVNTARFVLLAALTFSISYASSKDMNLYNGDVTFKIPDEYVIDTIPENNTIAYYAESGNKKIIVFAYRKNDFSVSKVLDGLDSYFCNLSEYKLVDTEKEYFWNITTDYVTRKYVSESGIKFASHIRYVTKGAYCFCFYYQTDDEYKDFQTLIKSIHFSEEEGFGQFWLIWKHNPWTLLLLLILVSIGSASINAVCESWKDKFYGCLLYTAIVAVLLIIPMWGFWIGYLSFLALSFVVCFLCSLCGVYFTPDFS